MIKRGDSSPRFFRRGLEKNQWIYPFAASIAFALLAVAFIKLRAE
jgi:hypothetical protein